MMPPSRGRHPAPDMLGALYALERVSGFGPVKFREMHSSGVDPRLAIERPRVLPLSGRTGEKLRAAISALSHRDLELGYSRAVEQLNRASACSASILVHGDPEYPRRVYQSNNPVPVLYVRGDPTLWTDRGSVAVVGSRKTGGRYANGARRFAATAAGMGLVVVSGFAIGADTIGHRAALEVRGRTVCVMPCGLDKVFPPENREFWEQLLEYPGAALVSEFGFGQRASSLLLRKRNKLIVAFAQGVLVAQSAANGGAMNAYRFGRAQKKPVATFTIRWIHPHDWQCSDYGRVRPAQYDIQSDERSVGIRTVACSTLLLDLDGTLWNSRPWYASVLARLSVRSAAELEIRLASGTNVAALAKECGVTKYRLAKEARLSIATLRFYGGVQPTLDALRDRGTLMGVVTNLPGWLVSPMTQASGIAELFDAIVTPRPGVPAKPQPHGIRRALEEMEREPSPRTWFLGDGIVDAAAARAAGVHFAWVSYGYEADAPPGAENVLDSFEDALRL